MVYDADFYAVKEALRFGCSLAFYTFFSSDRDYEEGDLHTTISFSGSFFLLDQKEPKNQECRIASGRHSAPCAWAATCMVVVLSLDKTVHKKISTGLRC